MLDDGLSETERGTELTGLLAQELYDERAIVVGYHAVHELSGKRRPAEPGADPIRRSGIELCVGQRVLRPLQVGREGDVIVYVRLAKRPAKTMLGRAAGGCIGSRRCGRELVGLIELEAGDGPVKGARRFCENQSQCWLHDPTGARSASLSSISS